MSKTIEIPGKYSKVNDMKSATEELRKNGILPPKEVVKEEDLINNKE